MYVNFTNAKAKITSYMQLVNNPKKYIPIVLAALKLTFPSCTNVIIVKILTSTENDPPQLKHTDFDLKHIHERVELRWIVFSRR
jgi:hypothetical protein